MTEQLDLDFKGRDVFAAAADCVLEAVDEVVVAVGVAEKRVAGVKPAVAPGVRGRLRIGVVAVVHGPRRFGAQDQLPDFAVLYDAVLFIDQPNLDARARPAANIILDRIGAGNQRRAYLGHVEQREEIDAETFAEGFADHHR